MVIWYEWSNMASSCVHSRKHEWSLTTISLEKKTGLDVMQSHPWCRMGFGQYHATSAVLGWPSAVLAFFPERRLSHAQNAVFRYFSLTSWWCLLHLWTPLWSSRQGTWSVSTRQAGEGGMCTELVSFYHTLQVQLHMCGLLSLILKPMYRDTAHRQISILGSPG